MMYKLESSYTCKDDVKIMSQRYRWWCWCVEYDDDDDDDDVDDDDDDNDDNVYGMNTNYNCCID